MKSLLSKRPSAMPFEVIGLGKIASMPASWRLVKLRGQLASVLGARIAMHCALSRMAQTSASVSGEPFAFSAFRRIATSAGLSPSASDPLVFPST